MSAVIKVNNIAPAHRKMYRYLRSGMGFQRRDAKLIMYGFCLCYAVVQSEGEPDGD